MSKIEINLSTVEAEKDTLKVPKTHRYTVQPMDADKISPYRDFNEEDVGLGYQNTLVSLFFVFVIVLLFTDVISKKNSSFDRPD